MKELNEKEWRMSEWMNEWLQERKKSTRDQRKQLNFAFFFEILWKWIVEKEQEQKEIGRKEINYKILSPDALKSQGRWKIIDFSLSEFADKIV